MAASAFVLFGALGMAVDIGRVLIGKSEVQAFCDSAALAATLQMNGTSGGITAAQNAVTNNANSWNLDSTRVSNPTVDFATSPSGPWSSNPGSATGYIYARVQATVPVNLFFIPVIVSQQLQNVSARAVAGQIAQPGIQQGLDPYSVVGPNPSDPNFGLVVGQQYDIQWPQYNGSRGGCGPSNPAQCFVQPPCSGESTTSMQEVVQNWGASINGYWGSNSNSTIDQEVLDEVQLQAVQTGGDIVMSTGNKNAEAVALDTRVNEDGDIPDNGVDAYQQNLLHNGRRLIALPIVTPVVVGGVAEGYVLGYGSFLLISNSHNPSDYYTSGNGNDPFCAIYAGAYQQGGTGTGGGNAGYFKVKLVQ
jgi:hypothetical protein